MGRLFSARVANTSRTFAVPFIAVAVCGIVPGVAAFVWFVAIAAPLVSFAVAVSAAMAWCAWLEKHPDVPLERDRAGQDIVTPGTSGRWAVHIVATTRDGTRGALTVARRLTSGLDARVVLLVPRLPSYSATFDPSGQARAAVIDEHRALAASIGMHVTVLLCVCRRYDDVVHQMLGRASLVIIGGRRRSWWPSREERLTARLSAEGYPVVFAQVGAERATSHASVIAS